MKLGLVSAVQPLLVKLMHHWHRFENSLLVLLLATMIGMSTLQIVLRNLFGFGIVWNESFLRMLVLWITLVGAMVATRNADHICIDVSKRYLPDAWATRATRLVNLASAAVCLIAAKYTADFVWLEYLHPYPAFGIVPTWLCALVIPIGFTVMGIRFVWQTLVVPQPKDSS